MMPSRHKTRLLTSLAVCLLISGCGGNRVPPPPPQANLQAPVAVRPANQKTDNVAPGVVHASISTGDDNGVDLIDLDLTRAAAHIEIATQNIGRTNGLISGDAYVPREWLAKRHALAAINGGYFGHEDASGRKEFIGLLVWHGKVRRAAPPLYGHGGTGLSKGYYIRSAFGLTKHALPSIVWASTDAADAQRVTAHFSPTAPESALPTIWSMDQAVGCGPMLIAKGEAVQTDRLERLVSQGARPRTFVAYDSPHGRPAQFVMGIANAMTYAELGQFLIGYFQRAHGTQVQAAMCVDGGASTQLSYRVGDTVFSPRDTGVPVPDSILIVPNKVHRAPGK